MGVLLQELGILCRAVLCPVQGLDRYVKKKKLDPLVTYVPLVLEAREVLDELEQVMGETHMCTPDVYDVYTIAMSIDTQQRQMLLHCQQPMQKHEQQQQQPQPGQDE